LPERESLEEVQFQAEEALEIGEGEEPEEAIENLRDIEDLDNQSLGEDDNDNDNESIALPLRQDGYPTPPLSEKLVQFLENDTIALLVKNIAIAQEDLNDNTLIEHGQREFGFEHVQKGSVSSFLSQQLLKC
jgi:hypothetical protein